MKYDRQVQMAIRMIKKYGREAHLIRQGGWTGTPGNPIPGQPVRMMVRAVRINSRVRSVNDPRIAFAVTKFLISTETNVIPVETDEIDFGDKVSTIQYIRTISPDGQKILYEVGTAS